MTAGSGTVAIAVARAAAAAIAVAVAIPAAATAASRAAGSFRDVAANTAVHGGFRQIERIDRCCQKDDAHRRR
jgi:hypothetical protein